MNFIVGKESYERTFNNTDAERNHISVAENIKTFTRSRFIISKRNRKEGIVRRSRDKSPVNCNRIRTAFFMDSIY